ncbi:uncharacterized protein LOC142523792 [Primulina tabacum]|uniref:uncharacterized protein LOC142523792 n=1 Tax=Primulina tabacum TaxID=48773 RepID=UPI003F5ABEF7
MRQHNLKLNPLKCAFGVHAGNFLGLLVHQRGVEVDKNKAKAIMTAMPPKTKKELQRFLRSGKLFKKIHFKPGRRGFPLKLYISAAQDSIGCLLAQNNQENHEQAVYYFSRSLTEMETDLVKYMLHRPILTGRIGKWSLALAEFTLIYCPQKSMKGQAVTDFLADHPMVDVAGSAPVDIWKWSSRTLEERREINEGKWRRIDGNEFSSGEDLDKVLQLEDIPVFCVSQSWTLKFDGSTTEKASGVGVVITSPTGIKTSLSFNLDFSCTNNQAEYEALVIGLEILRDLGAKDVLIIGDSQLVLKQMSGEYKCSSLALAPYFTAASQLLDDFEDVTFQHVPRQDNWEADELAQIASGLRMSP